MLEKLRDNPRAVVAALVAAGVLAVAVGASNQNTNNSGDVPSTPASEVSQEDQATTEEQNPDQNTTDEEGQQSTQTTPAEASTEPAAGPVSVTSEEGSLKATVRKGDNQTVIVRQMIADYLNSRSETLSAEQKLYAETTIVSKLPKDDTIFAGETLTVTETQVADTVNASKSLDQAAIARWNKYL